MKNNNNFKIILDWDKYIDLMESFDNYYYNYYIYNNKRTYNLEEMCKELKIILNND